MCSLVVSEQGRVVGFGHQSVVTSLDGHRVASGGGMHREDVRNVGDIVLDKIQLGINRMRAPLCLGT